MKYRMKLWVMNANEKNKRDAYIWFCAQPCVPRTMCAAAVFICAAVVNIHGSLQFNEYRNVLTEQVFDMVFMHNIDHEIKMERPMKLFTTSNLSTTKNQQFCCVSTEIQAE